MIRKRIAHRHEAPAREERPVRFVPERGAFKIENDGGQLSVLFNSMDMIRPNRAGFAVSFQPDEVAPYLARVRQERPENAPIFRGALAELRRLSR